MCELNLGGVKHEPLGGFAVEIVADNRAVEARMVRRMNAQLMRAACLGIEIDKRAPIGSADDRKTR